MHRKKRQLDTVPDVVDLRDWLYQPSLAPVPESLVNCGDVPEVLDQGEEGACTGFALAAVINYLLAKQGREHGVSPRMLYEMARLYDEWPGENYEGSSARGAIKGWVRHGVCRRKSWPDNVHGLKYFKDSIAKEASLVPGGAYYRIKQREIRDVHAALNEVGIVYATLMVHSGWDDPGRKEEKKEPVTTAVEVVLRKKKWTMRLPVIMRKGRATSGHAVAIVGYTKDGFIVQNSWGPSWGAEGFALLPYEDYVLHVMDVWVAQLGAPIRLEQWAEGKADTTAGLHRAASSIPLAFIRPHIINIGNNGLLSSSGSYWTHESDLQRLFEETIPTETKHWSRRRILLYVHGGLNKESDVAKRVVAMRDVLLANEIYPIHIMWETGLLSTILNELEDLWTSANERAGGGFMDIARETIDRRLERTASKFGAQRLWTEMKENARLASERSDGRGAMQMAARHAMQAYQKLSKASKNTWELHAVAHSAGCIFVTHAMPILASIGIPIKTIQFLAPAVRIDVFHKLMAPAIERGEFPLPTLYLLTNDLERDDTVLRVYGKSLLYFVSNACEDRPGTPLLGLHYYLERDPALSALYKGKPNERPSLILAGASGEEGSISRSRTHEGFDNDPDTMNSVLTRILDGPPQRRFTLRDLRY